MVVEGKSEEIEKTFKALKFTAKISNSESPHLKLFYGSCTPSYMIFKVISTFEACVLAYVMSPFFFFFCPEVGILEQVQFSLEVHRRIDLFIENCFRK